MMFSCGYCKHPGLHAQVMARGAKASSFCEQCPECRAERDERLVGTNPAGE
jgi:hypothetical protein